MENVEIDSDKKDGLEGKSSETSKLAESLTEKEEENVEMDADTKDAMVDLERSYNSGNEEAETKIADSLSEKSYELDDVDKSTGDLEHPVLDRSNVFSSVQGPALGTNGGPDLNDASRADTKDIDVSQINGSQKPQGTTNGSLEPSTSVKTSAIKDSHNAQHTGSSSKGSNQTLGRINLESWEKTKKADKAEANPLLAFVKSFVTAFVKFWSE